MNKIKIKVSHRHLIKPDMTGLRVRERQLEQALTEARAQMTLAQNTLATLAAELSETKKAIGPLALAPINDPDGGGR